MVQSFPLFYTRINLWASIRFPALLLALTLSISMAPAACPAESESPAPAPPRIVSGKTYESFRVKLEPADKEVLRAIRTAIGSPEEKLPSEIDIKALLGRSTLPHNAWGFAITLYQPGNQRLVVIRVKHQPEKDIIEAVKGIRQHKRFSTFAVDDRKRCRIQIDFLFPKPYSFDMRRASENALDSTRFEFGVDGLVVKADRKNPLYFLPGDAFVKSILGFNQLDRFLRKSLDVDSKIPLEYEVFQSQSHVSFENDWLPLYRGYPVTEPVGVKEVEDAVHNALEHLIRYQEKDGRFLYYYDAATDSLRNHEHPNRDTAKDAYYNIIRHCGVLIFIMKYHERYRDERIPPRVRLALWHALKSTVVYNLPDGQEAAYVLDNNKGKLGGSGILLHVLMEYQRISGDKVFAPYGERLVRHLLQEILPGGEFRYYSIYLGKPVPPEENSRYFGFYYPGEAVVGLAGYLRFGNPSEGFRKQIVDKLHHALKFLVHDRPKIYKDLFTSLPQDSWLVMGINSLWSLPEFRKDDYKAFAFATNEQTVQHMYTAEDALYPDYPGAFYYQYGDHPYPDGARAEGLVAAYELAKKTGDEQRAKKFHAALKASIKSIYLLVNTEKSVYSAPNPEKALGGIRFKLTRQWFRIDTTGHPAHVFIDFIPEWGRY